MDEPLGKLIGKPLLETSLISNSMLKSNNMLKSVAPESKTQPDTTFFTEEVLTNTCTCHISIHAFFILLSIGELNKLVIHLTNQGNILRVINRIIRGNSNIGLVSHRLITRFIFIKDIFSRAFIRETNQLKTPLNYMSLSTIVTTFQVQIISLGFKRFFLQ